MITFGGVRAAPSFVALWFAAAVAAQPSPQTQGSVRVEGNVAQAMSLTVDDLKRYPVHTVEYTPRSESERASANAVSPRHYTGCLLRDLLASAKPTERAPRDLRRSYVLVTAGDGYQVVFSWAELFISPVGDNVLVAYARDGGPLDRGEGPLALIAGTDTGPARHVKWLQSIELKTAAP